MAPPGTFLGSLGQGTLCLLPGQPYHSPSLNEKSVGTDDAPMESLKGRSRISRTPLPLCPALELKRFPRNLIDVLRNLAHTSLKGFQATGFVCPGSH